MASLYALYMVKEYIYLYVTLVWQTQFSWLVDENQDLFYTLLIVSMLSSWENLSVKFNHGRKCYLIMAGKVDNSIFYPYSVYRDFGAISK